jgi:hypothetical protein
VKTSPIHIVLVRSVYELECEQNEMCGVYWGIFWVGVYLECALITSIQLAVFPHHVVQQDQGPQGFV